MNFANLGNLYYFVSKSVFNISQNIYTDISLVLSKPEVKDE